MDLTSYIEKRIERAPESACWIWLACRNKLGYGVGNHASGDSRLAHRLAWIAYRGPIPDGMCVLHRCDVPCCVNPNHLFLGTAADNVADKVAKTRQARGEHVNTCKLTDADVRAIRADPRSHRLIARDYGVSKATAGKAKGGVHWKHVTTMGSS